MVFVRDAPVFWNQICIEMFAPYLSWLIREFSYRAQLPPVELVLAMRESAVLNVLSREAALLPPVCQIKMGKKISCM